MSIQDFRARARWPISGCQCAPAATSRFLAASSGTLSRTICSFAITSCTSPMPRAFCAKIFATRKKERPAFSPAGTRSSALTIRRAGLYHGDGGPSFPERDLTLQHPRCVFQTLRRHFARYTPEMVEKICGISPALFHKVADALVRASGPDKTAAICYALGWTQHSKGVQIIRTAAILQLLLGNIGRPGGGILALRGHASIQGSTDIPTLYDMLPGYLPMPRGDGTEETLARLPGPPDETDWSLA